MFYVYCIYDELGSPVYVGKGCKNRMFTSLTRLSKSTGKELKVNKISDNLSEIEAFGFESLLIKKLGRKHIEENGILENIMVENVSPDFKKVEFRQALKRKCSSHEYRKKRSELTINLYEEKPEIKEKISKSLKKRYKENPEILEQQKRTYKQFLENNPDHKQVLSKAGKKGGKHKLSDEGKRKVSIAASRENLSQETINKRAESVKKSWEIRKMKYGNLGCAKNYREAFNV